jgi:predicted O-methyltransferase YrrM
MEKNKNKIFVGIVTCDRPDFFNNCYESVRNSNNVDIIAVCNDGKTDVDVDAHTLYIKHEKNKGVGISKNDLLNLALKDTDADHIFILEDDMLIKNPDVFNIYVKSAEKSGIYHLNFGPGSPFNRKQDFQFDLHNRHECKNDTELNPKLKVEYSDGVELWFYEHTVAMLSYFHRSVLEEVGVHDEKFYNAWEHVDLTYRIAKAGHHTPFWWFADVANSDKLIDVAPEAIEKSSIAKDTEQWKKNVYGGMEIYKEKHGHYPNNPPYLSKDDVIKVIKRLKRKSTLLEKEKNGEVSDKLPDISQIPEEFNELLKIYKELKPKNVLEIGSLLGWSLKRFIENAPKDSNIISIDFPVREFVNPSDSRVDQQEFGHLILWKRWAKQNNVNLFVLPFSSFQQTTLEQVKTISKELDFVFIDGDHRYEAIKNDYYFYSPLVRKGGIIAFHDIAENEEGGGHRFWNEIKNNFKHKEILFSDKKEKGIGVLYV